MRRQSSQGIHDLKLRCPQSSRFVSLHNRESVMPGNARARQQSTVNHFPFSLVLAHITKFVDLLFFIHGSNYMIGIHYGQCHPGRWQGLRNRFKTRSSPPRLTWFVSLGSKVGCEPHMRHQNKGNFSQNTNLEWQVRASEATRLGVMIKLFSSRD